MPRGPNPGPESRGRRSVALQRRRVRRAPVLVAILPVRRRGCDDDDARADSRGGGRRGGRWMRARGTHAPDGRVQRGRRRAPTRGAREPAPRDLSTVAPRRGLSIVDVSLARGAHRAQRRGELGLAREIAQELVQIAQVIVHGHRRAANLEVAPRRGC